MMAAHIDKDGGLRPVAPDPYTGTADCHGTCAAWYNIACSNILTAIDGDYGTVLTWRSAVNQNAYYFVEVVAESGPAQIDERQLFGEKKHSHRIGEASDGRMYFEGVQVNANP